MRAPRLLILQRLRSDTWPVLQLLQLCGSAAQGHQQHLVCRSSHVSECIAHSICEHMGLQNESHPWLRLITTCNDNDNVACILALESRAAQQPSSSTGFQIEPDPLLQKLERLRCISDQ